MLHLESWPTFSSGAALRGNGRVPPCEQSLKICVVTSYTAAAEPRAPRHAIAAKRAFPNADVLLIDLAPELSVTPDEPIGLKDAQVARATLRFPTRSSDIARLGIRKVRTSLSKLFFRLTGAVTESVFGDRVQGLTVFLKGQQADLYIAHNIETLLPTFRAAQGHAPVVFDCMEYYSDMGESQSKDEAHAARMLERLLLPECSLVLASSDELADALQAEYDIRRPIAAYNVPAAVSELPKRRGQGLNLYWRNSVVDFSQRGLEDALIALSMLPCAVRLFLQGRLPADGDQRLMARSHALGIADRIKILPPYASQNAVAEAAAHDIGLCLERKGPRNHDLTVSNKMFDYHMAGLAIVSSDLPSLAHVIKRSGGGLVYKAGNPRSLADAILQLHSQPDLLRQLQERARKFALNEANLELELDRIANALRTVPLSKTIRTRGTHVPA